MGKTGRYIATARRARYDIIDAWLYPAYAMAAILRHATGTPIIVAGRRNLGDIHDRFGPFEQVAERAARRLTDAVVANSQAVADDAMRSGGADPARLRIIRNGVAPIARTGPRSARRIAPAGASRPRRWSSAASPTCARSRATPCCSTSSPRLPVSCRSTSCSSERGRCAPRSRAASPQRDSPRESPAGAQLDPRPTYSSFDVVVQASRSEGLPNAMLEASAAGRPILATAVGGTGEIVRDGETGILVPAEDRASFGAGLRRLLSDPALRTGVGRAAGAHVEATFGMDRFVREFADLYEELAISKDLLG